MFYNDGRIDRAVRESSGDRNRSIRVRSTWSHTLTGSVHKGVGAPSIVLRCSGCYDNTTILILCACNQTVAPLVHPF